MTGWTLICAAATSIAVAVAQWPESFDPNATTQGNQEIWIVDQPSGTSIDLSLDVHARMGDVLELRSRGVGTIYSELLITATSPGDPRKDVFEFSPGTAIVTRVNGVDRKLPSHIPSGAPAGATFSDVLAELTEGPLSQIPEDDRTAIGAYVDRVVVMLWQQGPTPQLMSAYDPTDFVRERFRFGLTGGHRSSFPPRQKPHRFWALATIWSATGLILLGAVIRSSRRHGNSASASDGPA